MEKLSPATLALLLAACAPSIYASSDTSLSAGGTLTTSACTATLSNQGEINHGKLTNQDLDKNKPTSLPPGEMQVDIQCEGPTLITLTTQDNRAGSSAINPAHHGLGMTDDNQKLGNVALGLFDPIADGVPVHTIISRNGGANWGPSSYLGHTALTAVAEVGGANTPIPLQHLTARLRAFTTIVPADGLPTANDMRIDGKATVIVKYW